MSEAKAWGMVLVAVLTYVYAALTNGGVHKQEVAVIVSTAIGAFVVYVVPNLSAGVGRWAKTIAAAATSGLATLEVVIAGGLTTAELIEVVLAAAAAVGLTAGIKNAGYAFASKLRAPSVP
jgi:DhnA family fructose-bisphosphate aldolase class Ia